MQYITLLLAIALSALFMPLYAAFTLNDVNDALQLCIDVIVAIHTAFMDYVAPTQEGMRALLVATYLAARSTFGRILGLKPLTAYDYVIERAKNNPLEAVGAIALVFLAVKLFYWSYRLVYRFFHWMLITRRTR